MGAATRTETRATSPFMGNSEGRDGFQSTPGPRPVKRGAVCLPKVSPPDNLTLVDLFDNAEETLKNAPLAERMRPRNLDEFLGQRHLLDDGKPLRQAILADKVDSMILWGPP